MFPKKGYCFDEMRLTFFSTWDAEAILEKSLGAKVLHVALLVVPSWIWDPVSLACRSTAWITWEIVWAIGMLLYRII